MLTCEWASKIKVNRQRNDLAMTWTSYRKEGDNSYNMSYNTLIFFWIDFYLVTAQLKTEHCRIVITVFVCHLD